MSMQQHQAVYRAGWQMEREAASAGRVAVPAAAPLVADACARYGVPVPRLTLKARVQRSYYMPVEHALLVAECSAGLYQPGTTSGMTLLHELAHAIHGVQYYRKHTAHMPRAIWHAEDYVHIYSQLIAQYLPACLPAWQAAAAAHNVRGV